MEGKDMNPKEILSAIREEIKPLTGLRYLPEDDKLFLGLFMSELGLDRLNIVELSMKLEKRFGIDMLDFEKDVRIQEIFDTIVHKTYSDEGTAMDSAAAACCNDYSECAAFNRGWRAGIKWYKENKI